MLFAEKFVQLDIILDKTLQDIFVQKKKQIFVSGVSDRLCEIWSKTSWVGPIQPPKRHLIYVRGLGGTFINCFPSPNLK